MTTSDPVSAISAEKAALANPFIKTLSALVRAEDSYGTWDKKSDANLLEPFVLTKQARREIPIIGDPDPETLQRVEQFYRAVGLSIEQRCGMMASPMMKISHEGFGRLILTVGKLVVFAKSLRDVHRFGYDGIEALAREGEKAVDQALATIHQYPEVAKA